MRRSAHVRSKGRSRSKPAGKRVPGKKVSSGLSSSEEIRYARHFLLREWNGKKGQLKLKKSKVLVVGAGGSGSSLLLFLAAAGVGTIRVCDGDVVELSNLNRQVIHNSKRLGMNKALSAAITMRELNPDIVVEASPFQLTEENIGALAEECDLLCSAADDRDAMRLMNKYCFESGVPLLWGGGFYLGGFMSLLNPPETVCVECCLAAMDAGNEEVRGGKHPEKEHMLVEEGSPLPIVGAAAGAAGAIQAMEAIKYLVGFGPFMKNMLFNFQLGSDERMFTIEAAEALRRPGCPYCGLSSRA